MKNDFTVELIREYILMKEKIEVLKIDCLALFELTQKSLPPNKFLRDKSEVFVDVMEYMMNKVEETKDLIILEAKPINSMNQNCVKSSTKQKNSAGENEKIKSKISKKNNILKNQNSNQKINLCQKALQKTKTSNRSFGKEMDSSDKFQQKSTIIPKIKTQNVEMNTQKSIFQSNLTGKIANQKEKEPIQLCEYPNLFKNDFENNEVSEKSAKNSVLCAFENERLFEIEEFGFLSSELCKNGQNYDFLPRSIVNHSSEDSHKPR